MGEQIWIWKQGLSFSLPIKTSPRLLRPCLVLSEVYVREKKEKTKAYSYEEKLKLKKCGKYNF